LLSDGTRARVATQTPETVRVVLPGGGPKTYPTADFCALAPRNLSEGFRLEVAFGVDYRHQAICTGEIPKKMLAALQRELPNVVPERQIERIDVLFMNAGASSLDYEAQADFTGDAAHIYKKLRFAMARILVDACNEHGWVIPFQQVTVHQAVAE
jgi:small-conductance mechanosensitive channel